MDRIAPRGVEAAVGREKLAIVTLKKTHKKNTNRQQPSKAKPFERISPY